MSSLNFNSNENKKILVKNFMMKTYGLNKSSVIKLCKKAGFCDNYKLDNLYTEQIETLTKILLDSKIMINQELKRIQLKKFEASLQIKTYKSIRKVKGYPANGQRTRSNAKTARKKLFFVRNGKQIYFEKH